VDADESPFSAELLREWKAAAENQAREALELAQTRDLMPTFVTVLHRSMELVPDRSLERAMPLLFRSVHEVVADVRSPFASVAEVDVRAAVKAQVGARDELWGHLEAAPSAELAYYGIAHVPLAIHMGHLLGTRVSAHFAERERDAPGWRWLPESAGEFPALAVERSKIPSDASDVAITLATSYRITPEQVFASVGEMPLISLAVPEPVLDVVRGTPQVEAYSLQFRNELEVVARIPSVERVHLFAAVSAQAS